MAKEQETKDEGLFPHEDSVMGTTGYRTFGKGVEDTPTSLEKETEEEEPEGEEEEEEASEEEGEEEEEDLEDEEEDEEDDVQKLKDDLREAKKEAGTLRMQANLMQQIHSDPATFLPLLAEQYGFEVVQQGQQRQEPTGDADIDVPLIEPKKDESMAEYMKRVQQATLQSMQKMMQQTLKGERSQQQKQQRVASGQQQVTEGKIKAALQYLDDTYDDWLNYEKTMQELLQKHPSYANDLDGLYETAKAMHGSKGARAASKVKRNARQADRTKVRTTRKGGKPVKTKPKGKMNFTQAWDRALADARK